MLSNVLRGSKVGAACWATGLVATMLVGTLVIGGVAGAVVASFQGAVAFYLNGHGFLLWELATGDSTVVAADSPIGPVAIALLTLLPLAVLLLGGAYLGGDVASPSQAVLAGATLALGYGATTVVALALVLQSMPLDAGVSGVATGFVRRGVATRVVVAGFVAPMLVGTAGALAGRRTERSI